MVPILRLFRIVRCNRQAALHSALFNYTPLVIRRTSKNKQLTIISQHKLALTAINELFALYIKSLEPLKKFKHQPRPLVRSRSLKFGQNFWNLSHETVPLKARPIEWCHFQTQPTSFFIGNKHLLHLLGAQFCTLFRARILNVCGAQESIPRNSASLCSLSWNF